MDKRFNENVPYQFYCVMAICIHGRMTNKVSTNRTINNVIKTLKHIEDTDECGMKGFSDWLLMNSGMPCRVGDGYKKSFICYPPSLSDEEKFEPNDWEKAFPKTEGLHFSEGEYDIEKGKLNENDFSKAVKEARKADSLRINIDKAYDSAVKKRAVQEM